MDIYRVSRRGLRGQRSKRSVRRRTSKRRTKRVSRRRTKRVSRRRNTRRVNRRQTRRRVNRRQTRRRVNRSNRRSRRNRRVVRGGSPSNVMVMPVDPRAPPTDASSTMAGLGLTDQAADLAQRLRSDQPSSWARAATSAEGEGEGGRSMTDEESVRAVIEARNGRLDQLKQPAPDDEEVASKKQDVMRYAEQAYPSPELFNMLFSNKENINIVGRSIETNILEALKLSREASGGTGGTFYDFTVEDMINEDNMTKLCKTAIYSFLVDIMTSEEYIQWRGGKKAEGAQRAIHETQAGQALKTTLARAAVISEEDQALVKTNMAADLTDGVYPSDKWGDKATLNPTSMSYLEATEILSRQLNKAAMKKIFKYMLNFVEESHTNKNNMFWLDDNLWFKTFMQKTRLDSRSSSYGKLDGLKDVVAFRRLCYTFDTLKRKDTNRLLDICRILYAIIDAGIGNY